VREYARQELAERLREAFDRVEFYGQNRVGPLRFHALQRLGRWSRRGAIWSHRLMKTPRGLLGGPEQHRVERQGSGPWEYEFLIAVCSGPRPGRAG
jgi:hypothetical protein